MAKNKTNLLLFVILNCTIVIANCVILQARVPNVAQANHSNVNETEDDVDAIERGSEIVDAALVPVYDMVKVFLVDIVQQNDLTYMEEKGVDFSDPDSILDSFENDYEEWIWYAIGKYISFKLIVQSIFFVFRKESVCFLKQNDNISNKIKNIISWATRRKNINCVLSNSS